MADISPGPPRAGRPEGTRPAGITSRSSRLAARILLAQVDPALVDLLARGLRRAGHHPTVAATRAEVLAAPVSAHDLLLLDDGCAAQEGLLMCQRLRAGNPATPLLLIGDRARRIDSAVASVFGASDYLAKPFRLGALLTRIQALLAPDRPLDVAGALRRHLPAGPHTVLPPI